MYGNIVNHDLHWIAGDSVNAIITYKVDGQPQNLSGASVRMVVRNPEGETGDEVSNSLVATYTGQVVLKGPVLNTPTTNTTGGSLTAGTYYYKVTAITPGGETMASNEVLQVTTGASSTVTLTWSAVEGATGYRIYRGTSAGNQTAFFSLTGAGLTFTDVGGPVTPGTPPSLPAENHLMITDPINGKIQFNIDAATTRSLNQSNDLKTHYVYSLEITKPAVAPEVPLVRTLLRGKLTVHSEIAR